MPLRYPNGHLAAVSSYDEVGVTIIEAEALQRNIAAMVSHVCVSGFTPLELMCAHGRTLIAAEVIRRASVTCAPRSATHVGKHRIDRLCVDAVVSQLLSLTPLEGTSTGTTTSVGRVLPETYIH